MHTEEQARTKWCPHVRVQVTQRDRYDNPPLNRETGDLNCIASECMTWRWFDDVTDDGTACNHKPTAKLPRLPENPPTMGHPLETRRGYCGKAGDP